MSEPKTLQRDMQRAMVSGVVAGVARYFDSDVNLFRLVFIALTIITGVLPGVIVYVCGMFLLERAER